MKSFAQNKPGRFRLSLPTMVTALLCGASVDMAALVGSLTGKLILPKSLVWSCHLIDQVFCGVAIGAVCPPCTAVRFCLLFGGLPLLFFFRLFFFTGVTLGSDILDAFALLWYLVGLSCLVIAALLTDRQFRHKYRRIDIEGVGEAWESQKQVWLAIFFGVCLVVAVSPDLFWTLRMSSLAQDKLEEIKRLINEGASHSNSHDIAYNSVLGIMGTAGLVGLCARDIVVALGFLSLVLRSFPRATSSILARSTKTIVWLRPFEIDGMPQGLATPWQLVFNPWRQTFGRTLEQRINRCFRGGAELVALGEPGEKLPQAGAARLYVDHSQWKPIVKALVGNSSGVILHAATSESTLWEWKQAIATLPRSRIILCVPVLGPSNRARNKKYQKLRSYIEQTTGILLPEDAPKKSAFAFFEADDSERSVWLRRGTWFQRGTRIPHAHPFAPSLMRLRSLKFSLETQSMIVLVILLAILVAVLVLYIKAMTR